MNRIDWLSPKPLFLIILTLGVYLPTFSFLRFEDSFSRVWPFLFFNKTATVMEALLIYTGVAIAFCVAHGRALKKPYSKNIRIINEKTFGLRMFVMVGVGLFSISAIIYFVGGIGQLLAGASDRTRAFSGLQGLFILLNILAAAAVGWLLRLTSRPTRLSEKLTFALFMLGALGVLALQGQKSTLFILIGALAIIFNARVRRFRAVEIVVGAVILYVGLMSYHIYKQEYLVLGRVASLGSGEQFWDTVYTFMNDQFFGNFMQLQTMSVLIEGTPHPLEYQYGYTYWSGLLLLIPRSLFPGKPLPSTGIFTEAFWPDMWRVAGTTLPAGVFGEGYMNFGIAGALGLAWLAGHIYGRIERRHRDHPADDFGLAIYAVMIAAMLHYFRGEVASVSYAAASIFLPILFLTTRRRASTPADVS